MSLFFIKQATPKDLMRDSKLDWDSIRLILGSIIFQWSWGAKCHARYLCKASGWEAWWSAEGGRQEHRKRERDSERLDVGLASVQFAEWVFSTPVPSVPPPSFSSLQRHGQYVWIASAHVLLRHVRYFLRWVEVNYTSRLAQLKLRRRFLCNSCCGTHLPGCI